jgi:uncharacterized protein YdeI (YjbR/CyaY-like superfamily)
VEAIEITVDLSDGLDLVPEARVNWEKFPKSSKRGILEWILNAKTESTRKKRVEETVRLAEENMRANHYRQIKGK